MAINLTGLLTPGDRGWGGPGLSSSQLVTLDCPTAHNLPMRVRREIAPLAQALVNELLAVRKRFGKPLLDSSGGYNKRYISGTTKWSNHSWGLAMDFNAGANPYAINGGTDFPVAETRAIAHKYGFRWGYDYNGKKDAMHFEFMGTLEDARTLIASLGTTTSPSEEDDMTPEQSRKLDAVYDELTKRLPNRVGPKASQEGTGADTILGYAANSDAYGTRIERLLTTPQKSRVTGSTVSLPPLDAIYNVDARTYEQAQRIAGLQAAVEQLAKAVAAVRGIDEITLVTAVQNAIKEAVVKVDVSVKGA